jgi:hypothetical protein
MQIKFKLVPGTAIDGIVKSLQESTTDPIIDIHIERGEVEVKSRPSFYTKRPVFSDAYLEKCDDAPYAGCDCDLCEAIRKYRGFGL